LEVGKHEAPPTWDDEAATMVGDRPAIGMKWESAAAYCQWEKLFQRPSGEGGTGTMRRYPWRYRRSSTLRNITEEVGQEAITLWRDTAISKRQSVRHGLKGREKPVWPLHMRGTRQNGWPTGTIAATIKRVLIGTRQARPPGRSECCEVGRGRTYRLPCV
jgi:hypothetical protein